jgi:hypothetical protein
VPYDPLICSSDRTRVEDRKLMAIDTTHSPHQLLLQLWRGLYLGHHTSAPFAIEELSNVVKDTALSKVAKGHGV